MAWWQIKYVLGHHVGPWFLRVIVALVVAKLVAFIILVAFS